MEEGSNHGLREVPGRPEAPAENPRVEEGGERRAARGSERVRELGEIVAIVSAGVLAGGGAGMLGGAALGAINPFFLGTVGMVLGIGASVPLARAVLKRSEAGTGTPARAGPTQDPAPVPGRPAVSPENEREQAEEGREQRAEEGRGDLTTRLRLFVRRLFGG